MLAELLPEIVRNEIELLRPIFVKTKSEKCFRNTRYQFKTNSKDIMAGNANQF